MLKKLMHFIKTLPTKTCIMCGEEIIEQHECYTNKCHKCNIY